MLLAHNLIESLNKHELKLYVTVPVDEIDNGKLRNFELSAATAIKNAQKFKLGSWRDLPNIKGWDKITSDNYEQIDEFRDYCKLPYGCSYFEIEFDNMTACLVASHLNEGPEFRVDVFLKSHYNSTFGSAGIATAIFQSEKELIQISPCDIFVDFDRTLSFLEMSSDEAFDNNFDMAFLVAACLCKALIFINCSNIKYKDNPAPRLINQKRKKKGKTPIYSYKTLILDTSEKTVYRRDETQERQNRQGPRIHLRRGHIRKLYDSRLTWVKPCVVGKNKTGIVEKDYKVI